MYRYYFQKEKRTFAAAIQAEAEYIGKSKYYEQISRYLKYFKKEQMMFLTLEQIKQEPSETIRKIYDFLEVKTDFVPQNVYGKANAAKQIRSPFLNKMTKIV